MNTIRIQNIRLDNVASSFNAVKTKGVLQNTSGGMLFLDVVQSHIQGMGFYTNSNGSFILLSHNDHISSTGALIAINIQTGNTIVERSSQRGFSHASALQV